MSSGVKVTFNVWFGPASSSAEKDGEYTKVPGTFACASSCAVESRVPYTIVAGVSHVIVGVALATVSTIVCVASGAVPLLAMTVIAMGEPIAFFGVPLNTPVVESRLAQDGRFDAAKVGAGVPVAATTKLPSCPTAKFALFGLVIAGGTATVWIVSVPSIKVSA
jgi:hypothetical protein